MNRSAYPMSLLPSRIRPSKTYQRNLLKSIHNTMRRAEYSYQRGAISFDEMRQRCTNATNRLPYPLGSQKLSDWLWDA